MRPVMHGDVVAAARLLYAQPRAARDAVLRRLLRQTEFADRYRAAEGRAHPFWGDGSLMTAALAHAPPPEPRLEDAEYCACLAQVFEALVSLGRSSRRSAP